METYMNLPLNLTSSYDKIGYCGPFNWVLGSYCNSKNTDFIDSVWRSDKLYVK